MLRLTLAVTALVFTGSAAMAGGYGHDAHHDCDHHHHRHHAHVFAEPVYDNPTYYAPRPVVRMETSVHRAGLGGGSIIRANNESDDSRVFYIYTPRD